MEMATELKAAKEEEDCGEMEWQIQQDGAGTYIVRADDEESAILKMASQIVENCEDWQTQFCTNDVDVAIEKASSTLSVVE